MSFELLRGIVSNYFQPHLDPRHFMCNQRGVSCSMSQDTSIPTSSTFFYTHPPNTCLMYSSEHLGLIFVASHGWPWENTTHQLLSSQPIGFPVAHQQGMHPSGLSFDGHATQGQIGLTLQMGCQGSNLGQRKLLHPTGLDGEILEI